MINLVLKIQENEVLLRLYRVVSSYVQLVPYYVMEEFFDGEQDGRIAPKIAGVEIALLSRDEMAALELHEESMASAGEYVARLDRGCLCLAAKVHGQIAAYSWCDPTRLSYKNRTLRLKSNEAYLFDARTYQGFRGKNLAPFIRHKFYGMMKERGVDTFYSITLLSNTASMKFKRKVGATLAELTLYVGLFKSRHMHLRLKRYRHR